MKKLYEDFKAFAFRGDIIGLAVAFVMAVAFANVISAVVNDIIMPIVAIIFGTTDFSGLVWHLRDAAIYYGSFITSLVTFLAIAFGVFFLIIKPYEAYKNMKMAGGETEAASVDDERVALLREIRDALKK
jgi:large conductance mechanosensitive channel